MRADPIIGPRPWHAPLPGTPRPISVPCAACQREMILIADRYGAKPVHGEVLCSACRIEQGLG